MYKCFIQCLSVMILFVSVVEGRASESPNIILIITDDQGYGSRHVKNPKDDPLLKGKNRTARYRAPYEKVLSASRKAMPNLERLAQRGVHLTDAYVASSVCAPSRAAVLSGKYPQRFGVYTNKEAVMAYHKEFCIAQALKQGGYKNAVIGKWHLGKSKNERVAHEKDYHKNERKHLLPGHHPLDKGFDYYYGFASSGASYYNSPSLFRNRDNVKAKGYLTDDLTDEALSFIDKHHQEKFFVYLAYNAPHIPLIDYAPDNYLGRFDTGNKEVDNYFAALAAVDDGVGKIMQKLEDKGISENTLIIYLSDNGAVYDSPQTSNGQFRGHKGGLSQGGTRIPMFMVWPKKLKAAQEYKSMVMSIDLAPSILHVAGLSDTVKEEFDGVNLFPYLTEAVKGDPHECLFWAKPQSYHWSEVNGPYWEKYFHYLHDKGEKPHSRFREHQSSAAWAVRMGKWMLRYE